MHGPNLPINNTGGPVNYTHPEMPGWQVLVDKGFGIDNNRAWLISDNGDFFYVEDWVTDDLDDAFDPDHPGWVNMPK